MKLYEGQQVIAFYRGVVKSASCIPIIEIQDDNGKKDIIIDYRLEYIWPFNGGETIKDFFSKNLRENPNPSAEDIVDWLNEWQVIASDWMTVYELAEKWGVSRHTVSRFIKKGGYSNVTYVDGEIRVSRVEGERVSPSAKTRTYRRLIG